MHAIPAQTANQGLPFEKETLPGPGKLGTVMHTQDLPPCSFDNADSEVRPH